MYNAIWYWYTVRIRILQIVDSVPNAVSGSDMNLRQIWEFLVYPGVYTRYKLSESVNELVVW